MPAILYDCASLNDLCVFMFHVLFRSGSTYSLYVVVLLNETWTVASEGMFTPYSVNRLHTASLNGYLQYLVGVVGSFTV